MEETKVPEVVINSTGNCVLGHLDQLSSHLATGAKLADLRTMLVAADRLMRSLSEEQRRPVLVLYLLFNAMLPPTERMLSSNDAKKLADWVAYRMAASTIRSTPVRRWRADPALAEEETLEPEDYDGAHAALGADRGHRAPLARFAGAHTGKS